MCVKTAPRGRQVHVHAPSMSLTRQCVVNCLQSALDSDKDSNRAPRAPK